MGEKVVLITGGNSGLGYKAAEMLVQKGGYEVIIACRSEEKAEDAIKRLKQVKPETTASYMKLDLASLESVREFVDKFRATGKKLHALINNAGMATGFRDTNLQRTKDGFEMTFGTNHLGHFLLTVLLVEVLKKTASEEGEARIVVVSSSLHNPDEVTHMKENLEAVPFDFDNLQLEKPGTYNGARAYSRSKLANLFFAYELARRLEGTGVTVIALCPGFIPDTSLNKSSPWMMMFMLRYILSPILRWRGVTRTLEHGAGMIVAQATSDEYKGVTGKYFSDYAEKQSSELSRDVEKGKKLWDISAEMVKYEEAKNL